MDLPALHHEHDLPERGDVVERVAGDGDQVRLEARREGANVGVGEDAVTIGRTGPAPTSTATWDGDRLVITARYPFQDPATGRSLTQEVTQTLWLQPATGTPWGPSLVVETMRGGALGGPASVTRTVYSRGYRLP